MKCFYDSADLLVSALINERPRHEQCARESVRLGLLFADVLRVKGWPFGNACNGPKMPWNYNVPKLMADGEPLPPFARVVLAQKNLRPLAVQAYCDRIALMRPGDILNIAVIIRKRINIDRRSEAEPVDNGRSATGGWIPGRR